MNGLSADVRVDFEKLMNVLFPLAEETLNEHGEFYPVGARMNLDGTVELVASYNRNERPDSQDAIDMLREGFRQEAKDPGLRATGICYNLRTIPSGQSERVDAIAISMEHVSGGACTVFQLYGKRPFRKLRLGALYVRGETATIFAGDDQGAS